MRFDPSVTFGTIIHLIGMIALFIAAGLLIDKRFKCLSKKLDGLLSKLQGKPPGLLDRKDKN